MPAWRVERRVGLLLSELEPPPQALRPITLQAACKPSMLMDESTRAASRSMCLDSRATRRRRPGRLSAKAQNESVRLVIEAVVAAASVAVAQWRRDNDSDRRGIGGGAERQGVDGENRSGRSGKVLR